MATPRTINIRCGYCTGTHHARKGGSVHGHDVYNVNDCPRAGSTFGVLLATEWRIPMVAPIWDNDNVSHRISAREHIMRMVPPFADYVGSDKPEANANETPWRATNIKALYRVDAWLTHNAIWPISGDDTAKAANA